MHFIILFALLSTQFLLSLYFLVRGSKIWTLDEINRESVGSSYHLNNFKKKVDTAESKYSKESKTPLPKLGPAAQPKHTHDLSRKKRTNNP
jgi:hypothetical protein